MNAAIAFVLRAHGGAPNYQAYDVALAGTGLRATQFSLLVTTHHLGTPTMKRLAQMLDCDPTTITRNVQGLIKRRLLTLFPGTRWRERKVTLTKKGQAILLRALPNWRVAQSRRRVELQSRRADEIAGAARADRAAGEESLAEGNPSRSFRRRVLADHLANVGIFYICTPAWGRRKLSRRSTPRQRKRNLAGSKRS